MYFQCKKINKSPLFTILDAAYKSSGGSTSSKNPRRSNPPDVIPVPSRIYLRKLRDEVQSGILLECGSILNKDHISILLPDGKLLTADLDTKLERNSHSDYFGYEVYIDREGDTNLIAELQVLNIYEHFTNNKLNSRLSRFYLNGPSGESKFVGSLRKTTTRPAWVPALM